MRAWVSVHMSMSSLLCMPVYVVRVIGAVFMFIQHRPNKSL